MAIPTPHKYRRKALVWLLCVDAGLQFMRHASFFENEHSAFVLIVLAYLAWRLNRITDGEK